MRRPACVVFVLLVTLTLGIALQPDDGTAVSRPDGVGLKVDGANHAKPLPRIVSAGDFLPALSVAITVVAAFAATSSVLLPRRRDAVLRAPELLLARAVSRRGPPVLA